MSTLRGISFRSRAYLSIKRNILYGAWSMYKISEIVSKQVVELSLARVLGTVVNVSFSPSLKRADGLLLFDENENDETLLSLPIRSVSAVNEMIVVRSLSAPLKECPFPVLGPINRPCCNHEGKRLGTVTDAILSDDFSLSALQVGETRYAADKLLAFSDSLVIINDSDSPVRLPKKKIRRPKAADKEIRVKAAAVQLPTASEKENSEQNASGAVSTPTAQPSERVCLPDFSFLIGKKVAEALLSKSGVLIAAPNSIITQDTIDAAASENRLVHLALRAL